MTFNSSRMIPAIALLSVALVVAPVASFAKGEGRASFEQLDSDGDGALTAAELAAHAATRFEAADTDNDGNLSSAELLAAETTRKAERAERRIERMIERRDENGDGVLSAAELTPSEDRATKRFERMDANDDGSISEEEFKEASKRGRGHRGERGGEKRGE
ncbi:MAG: calcium-binding protein [Litoreibacter sp.]